MEWKPERDAAPIKVEYCEGGTEPTEDSFIAKDKKSRVKGWRIAVIAIAAVLLVGVGALTGYVWKSEWAEPSEQKQSEREDILPDRNETVYMVPTGAEDGPSIQLADRPHGEGMSTEQLFAYAVESVATILSDHGDGAGLGSGVVISEDGYILTNEHIIAGCRQLTVRVGTATEIYDATLIGYDVKSDLAVIKVDAAGLKPAVFGDSDQALIGEELIAIGNPYSVQYMLSVTRGILSGMRYNADFEGVTTDLLQTDAALNPGNSGGPLINKYGQVIGIVRSKIMKDGEEIFEGLSFGIPSAYAKEIVDEFMATGKIEPKPVIGINVVYLDEQTAAEEEVVPGCLVVSIESSCDAYEKGLRMGDVVTQINGKTFSNVDDFIAEKDRFGIGDEITVTYWREGEYQTITIRLVSSN